MPVNSGDQRVHLLRFAKVTYAFIHPYTRTRKAYMVLAQLVYALLAGHKRYLWPASVQSETSFYREYVWMCHLCCKMKSIYWHMVRRNFIWIVVRCKNIIDFACELPNSSCCLKSVIAVVIIIVPIWSNGQDPMTFGHFCKSTWLL